MTDLSKKDLGTDLGTIVVTGGSRGIGASISLRLAAAGYAVLVNYARDAAAAEAVVERITAAGGRALAHRADMADEAAIATMFSAADAIGPARRSRRQRRRDRRRHTPLP